MTDICKHVFNKHGYKDTRVQVYDIQELDRVITNMRSAFDKPILTKDDFIGDPKI